MKIIKYAAVAAIAIGLCGTQCRGLSASEWMNNYVSKITSKNQKIVLASYLFWNIKQLDAHTAYNSVKSNPKLADNPMVGVFESANIRGAEMAAGQVYNAADKATKEACDAAKNSNTRDEFYVALWKNNNFGTNVLRNTKVVIGSITSKSKIDFPEPKNGKIESLYKGP